MKTIISILIIAIAFPAMSQMHQFKELPYAYDALEPYIDSTTMKVHYEKHHRGYYNKFINGIEKHEELQTMEMIDIFANISKYEPVIRNNGGGYWNHEFFWESMTPGGSEIPEGAFKDAFMKAFKSMDNFKKEFKDKALTLFGSGWVWLILNENKELQIVQTANQDNPLMDVAKIKGIPLLGLDVWEHAYYLKYQNNRGTYIDNFFNLIDWEKVNERYDAAIK